MLRMVEVEVEEIENIQKELDNNVISLSDIDNRLEEEEEEVALLTIDDLTRTTKRTRPTTQRTTISFGRLPLLAG